MGVVFFFFLILVMPQAADAKTYTANNRTQLYSAIEKVKKDGGGTINLKGRTFTNIDKPLNLPANITLKGVPGKTVLQYTGSKNKSVIQRSGKIGKIVIRDLTINGKDTDEVDGAANCIKIDGTDNLYSTRHSIKDVRDKVTAGDRTKLKIRNVTAKNCRVQGIMISDINGVQIKDLKLDDNGSTMLHHNIYLRRVYNAVIENVDSRNAKANGFNASQVRYVTLKNYTGINNGQDGARFARSEHTKINGAYMNGNKRYGVSYFNEDESASGTPVKNSKDKYNYNAQIINSTIEGNYNHGMYLRYIKTDKTRGKSGFTIQNNVVRKNKGYGTLRAKSPTGKFKNNSFSNNSKGSKASINWI